MIKQPGWIPREWCCVEKKPISKGYKQCDSTCITSVQLLSHVWLFVTPWTAACKASLSITNSQSLLKLMSIESVMPSNHFTLCRLLLFLPSIFPNIRVFSNESVLCIRCQSTGVSALALVLPMNIQDWFPLGLTGWGEDLRVPWTARRSNQSILKETI